MNTSKANVSGKINSLVLHSYVEYADTADSNNGIHFVDSDIISISGSRLSSVFFTLIFSKSISLKSKIIYLLTISLWEETYLTM